MNALYIFEGLGNRNVSDSGLSTSNAAMQRNPSDTTANSETDISNTRLQRQRMNEVYTREGTSGQSGPSTSSAAMNRNPPEIDAAIKNQSNIRLPSDISGPSWNDVYLGTSTSSASMQRNSPVLKYSDICKDSRSGSVGAGERVCSFQQPSTLRDEIGPSQRPSISSAESQRKPPATDRDTRHCMDDLYLGPSTSSATTQIYPPVVDVAANNYNNIALKELYKLGK